MNRNHVPMSHYIYIISILNNKSHNPRDISHHTSPFHFFPHFPINSHFLSLHLSQLDNVKMDMCMSPTISHHQFTFHYRINHFTINSIKTDNDILWPPLSGLNRPWIPAQVYICAKPSSLSPRSLNGRLSPSSTTLLILCSAPSPPHHHSTHTTTHHLPPAPPHQVAHSTMAAWPREVTKRSRFCLEQKMTTKNKAGSQIHPCRTF